MLDLLYWQMAIVQQVEPNDIRKITETAVQIAPVFQTKNGMLQIMPYIELGQYDGFKLSDLKHLTTVYVSPGVKAKVFPLPGTWLKPFVSGQFYYRNPSNEWWAFGGLGLQTTYGKLTISAEYGRWMERADRYNHRINPWLTIPVPEYYFHGSYYTIEVSYGRLFANYKWVESDGQVQHAEWLWFWTERVQPSQHKIEIGWRF